MAPYTTETRVPPEHVRATNTDSERDRLEIALDIVIKSVCSDRTLPQGLRNLLAELDTLAAENGPKAKSFYSLFHSLLLSLSTDGAFGFDLSAEELGVALAAYSIAEAGQPGANAVNGLLLELPAPVQAWHAASSALVQLARKTPAFMDLLSKEDCEQSPCEKSLLIGIEKALRCVDRTALQAGERKPSDIACFPYVLSSLGCALPSRISEQTFRAFMEEMHNELLQPHAESTEGVLTEDLPAIAVAEACSAIKEKGREAIQMLRPWIPESAFLKSIDPLEMTDYGRSLLKDFSGVLQSRGSFSVKTEQGKITFSKHTRIKVIGIPSDKRRAVIDTARARIREGLFEVLKEQVNKEPGFRDENVEKVLDELKECEPQAIHFNLAHVKSVLRGLLRACKQDVPASMRAGGIGQYEAKRNWFLEQLRRVNGEAENLMAAPSEGGISILLMQKEDRYTVAVDGHTAKLFDKDIGNCLFNSVGALFEKLRKATEDVARQRITADMEESLRAIESGSILRAESRTRLRKLQGDNTDSYEISCGTVKLVVSRSCTGHALRRRLNKSFSLEVRSNARYKTLGLIYEVPTIAGGVDALEKILGQKVGMDPQKMAQSLYLRCSRLEKQAKRQGLFGWLRRRHS